jgi:hypothetical protein
MNKEVTFTFCCSAMSESEILSKYSGKSVAVFRLNRRRGIHNSSIPVAFSESSVSLHSVVYDETNVHRVVAGLMKSQGLSANFAIIG